MIDEAETDENGYVDLPEILMLLARKMKDTDTYNTVQEAFKVYDKGNSGEISIEDLGNIMLNLGDKLSEDEIATMVREADEDGNG